MKKVFLFAIAAFASISMFADNITVAKAIEIGEKLADNAETTESYVVEGYCVKLYGGYSADYGNQTFYMDDNKDADPSLKTYKFEAYRCKIDKEVLPQSKVTVAGKIKKYVSDKGVTTIEIAQGNIVILEEGPAIEVINVAKALELGNALGDNEFTKKYYTVQGYAVTAYPPQAGKTTQTLFMADELDTFGEFEAFACDPGKDNVVEEGEFVAVTGLIQKYVKSGSDPQIEIPNGTIKKVTPSAINNVNAEAVKAMKVVEDGQLYIIRNGVKYNAAGAVVK